MNSNSLACAYRDGIIGSPGYLHNSNVRKGLNEQVPGELPERAELQRIALNTKTTDMIKHSFGPQLVTNIDLDDWIELARIPCQFGSVTTLRNINTFVGDPSGRVIGRPLASFLEYTWVEFHLAYTSIEPRPQRIFQSAYAGGVNPGVPCFQLPFWQDNRFDANQSIDNELTIPCTPGRSLSLFARFIGAEAADIVIWQDGLNFKKGDTAFDGAFQLFIATTDHESLIPNRPTAANSPWVEIAAPLEGYNLKIWGELEASNQSEQNLSALWQAERTYDT
jgi:hypothetical protein